MKYFCHYLFCLSLSKDLAKDRPDKIQCVNFFALDKRNVVKSSEGLGQSVWM